MITKEAAAEFMKKREKLIPVIREFGPERNKAIPMFEDVLCYDLNELVVLGDKYRKIMFECTDEERPELISDFATFRDSMKKLPNAPERIYLWREDNYPSYGTYTENPDYQVNRDPSFRPYLWEMLIPENVIPKGLVVVCPGGDHGEALLYEGFGVAKALNESGYQCLLCCNRPNGGPYRKEEAAADVSRIVRYARKNAARFRVPEDRIAYAGFSNGAMTGDNLIRLFSGEKKMTDYFPEYTPDELDHYYGAPDAFLCVYGPARGPYEWDGVVYPPTFIAVGREDFALFGLYELEPDLRAHNIPVEIHTFAGVPHGKAGYKVFGHGYYENFDLWIPLADAFMQDVYRNR